MKFDFHRITFSDVFKEMVLYNENEQPGKVHKLCWTLKEPLTIRKQEGRDFSLLLLWLIYCLSGYLSSWSDYLFSRLCCHCWEYAAILLQRILRGNQVTRIKSSKKIDDRLYILNRLNGVSIWTGYQSKVNTLSHRKIEKFSIQYQLLFMTLWRSTVSLCLRQNCCVCVPQCARETLQKRWFLYSCSITLILTSVKEEGAVTQSMIITVYLCL